MHIAPYRTSGRPLTSRRGTDSCPPGQGEGARSRGRARLLRAVPVGSYLTISHAASRGEAFADGGQRPFAVMQATMTAVVGRPGING
jgi:hypothetical protein